MKASLAWILVNRDGPASSPARGTTRARGSATARSRRAALLEFGFSREVREFLALVRAATSSRTGRSRAASTARGADPTPEHDSNGEFIYAIAEYYRFTRDSASLRDLWPNVVARGRLPGGAPRAQRTTRSTARRRSARSTASCPSRSATRATPRIRCTRTGTTSSRCAASRTPPASRRALGDDGAGRARSRRSATRSARRSTRSIERDDERCTASTTSRPRSSSATSTRPRPRSLSTGGELGRAARARAAPDVREYCASFASARARRAGARGVLAATSSATPTPSSAWAAREGARGAARLLARRPAPARVAPVARDHLARHPRRRTSSATCRTPGSGSTFMRAFALGVVYERDPGRRARARGRRPAARGCGDEPRPCAPADLRGRRSAFVCRDDGAGLLRARLAGDARRAGGRHRRRAAARRGRRARCRRQRRARWRSTGRRRSVIGAFPADVVAPVLTDGRAGAAPLSTARRPGAARAAALERPLHGPR